MVQLTEAIAALTAVSTMQLANTVSGAKIVMRPTPFTGERGGDACRFLAAFNMWAMAQGSGLNVVDGQGNPIRRRNNEWIRTVLSLMSDDAAVWAAPAMEEFAGGQIPFAGVWENFRTEFRARFETSDESGDAKETLRVLWQGNSTVPEYAALFKQVMGQTGYSAADLRDRFYDHLNGGIKDLLVTTGRETRTLDELIAIASGIDLRVHQHCAEKERERRRSAMHAGNNGTPARNPNPNLIPIGEPVKMDVDATRTKEGYMRQMRGRCFGCGSTDHTKQDGNHERDLCKHCMRIGHLEAVCLSKYMRQPKSQKAAATSEEEDPFEVDLFEEEPEEVEEARVAATHPDILTQLLEQQKELAGQIAKWRAEDF